MLSLKVHEYSKGTDGGQPVLSRINPYVVLSKGHPEGSTRVFIQGGEFYWEGGEALKKSEIPDWLDDEIAKLSPNALKECGLQDYTSHLSSTKVAEMRRARIKALEKELAHEMALAVIDPDGDPEPDEEV